MLNENVVTVGSSSTQSAVMHAAATPSNQSRCVRVVSDTDCWVNWGSNPTALNTGLGGRMIGAGNPEYFDILANDKIACIERL